MTLHPGKPRALNFASYRRICLVDGQSEHRRRNMAQRIMDLLDHRIGMEHVGRPTLPVVYHDVDVLVAGSNPLLNALALRSAAQAGRRAALFQTDHADNWSYNLVRHPLFRQTVSRRLGLRAHEPSAIEPDTEAFFVKRLFGDMATQMSLREWTFDVVDAPSLTMGAQRDDKEAIVFVGEPQSMTPAFGLQAEAITAFQRNFCNNQNRLLLCTRPRRRTVLFVRKVILTSNLPGFADAMTHEDEAGDARLSSLSPFIAGFGTARLLPASRESALKAAIADILDMTAPDMFEATSCI